MVSGNGAKGKQEYHQTIANVLCQGWESGRTTTWPEQGRLEDFLGNKQEARAGAQQRRNSIALGKQRGQEDRDGGWGAGYRKDSF